MDYLFEPFQHAFMQRALVACVVIGFLNGFLGAFVVLRRMALMADSLSHSLLPGLAVGVSLHCWWPLARRFLRGASVLRRIRRSASFTQWLSLQASFY